MPKTAVRNAIDRAKRYVAVEVWKPDLRKLPFHRAMALRIVRIAYLAVHGSARDKAFLRASTLSYVTLLTLPPVLAIAFGIGKSLGATNKFREFLFHKLGAEQEQIRLVVDEIFQYVDSTPLSVLSGMGILFLFAAVVKLLGTIESSFNEIFGALKARSIPRKIADYLSVIILAPILLTVATGASATLQNQDLIQQLEGIPIVGAIVSAPLISSFATIWFGFLFLYLFMPNVRIKLSAAAIGALTASIGWLAAYQVFLTLQIGLSKANIIYGSFAGLPIMLIWLNVSWGIVLLGSEVVAALQNETAFKHKVIAGDPTPADRERYSLQIMLGVAQRFLSNQTPHTAEEFVTRHEIPQVIAAELLQRLENGALLLRTAGSPVGYVLSRDPSSTRISEILRVIRGSQEEKAPELEHRADSFEEISRATLSGLETAALASGNDRTLAELVETDPEPEPAKKQNLVTLPRKKRLDS